MTFTKIGDVLAKRRPVLGPSRTVLDAMVIIGVWPSILLDIDCVEKFERTRALSFHNGRLIIQAASNTVMSELKMYEQKILLAYEKRFKTKAVERLIIRRN